MARGNRKATAIGSGIRRQAPSKPLNKRRNNATRGNALRIGAPYFAHDALDPAIYPANIRQPVGGPSPNPTIIELEGDDSDDAVLDVGSEADDESENLAKTRKDSKSNRPPVRPLRDVKRIRVEGGRAPAPKRIQADLDSDDELIVKMKAEKFTDKQIAARLREEGRVNYHYKTISSRWIRIKNALEKRRDQDLDDQLTDWHEGDDYVLLQAISAADREIYRLKQAVQERKWRLVSMQMRDIKPSTNYSKDACRSRFEALENDTATIPPELDDDPEKRAIQREEAKENAAENIARLRSERAEELGNIRGANGASKRIHTAVKETPASSSRVGTPGPARDSLPVNRVFDVSDDTSSLSDLDSKFGGSSFASDDEILSTSKPTGLLPVKGLTRDNSGSLVVQSQEISTRQGSPESSSSSGANIEISDPESAQPHKKLTFVPTEHQASRRQTHSTQQEDTYSTGSEGEAVVQGAEHFLKGSIHEECTENLRSSGQTTKSRTTTELLTSLSTLASPASSDTRRSGTSVISQQRPLSVVKDRTSPSAQLLLELQEHHLVEEATKDQTIKKVETKRAAAMENRPPTNRELEAILRTKDFEDLLAASRRLSLNPITSKSILISQLVGCYFRGFSAYDPIFTPSRLQAASQPDTHGQTRPEYNVSPEAADESLTDNAQKRIRRSAPITGEDVTVADFAYTRGSEQIGLGPRLIASKEHMEAKDESEKKRKRSLAGGVRKNSIEAGRGPGDPNADRNPSRPLKHPRASRPKPAAGDPAVQAQLNPLDASLFYAANNSSMGEPRATVASRIEPPLFYAANNRSMTEPGSRFSAMINMPPVYAANNPINMPPVYGIGNLGMGESGANVAATTDTPRFYTTNNPTIDPSLLDSPMPQSDERKSPIVKESAAYDPTMIDTPSDEDWEVDNPVVTANVRQFAPQPQQRTQAQPSTQQPSQQAGRHGGTGTLTGRREPTYHRVRLSNLPHDAREDELEDRCIPFIAAVIDMSKVSTTRTATLFFDDRYIAQAAALTVDGARLRSYNIRATMVDL